MVYSLQVESMGLRKEEEMKQGEVGDAVKGRKGKA